MHGRLVANREFVEPCGDASVAFEAVDAALDRVALLVDLWVECRWPPTGPAAVAAMPDLIRGLGNRARDPAPPQIGPVGAGTVGLRGSGS